MKKELLTFGAVAIGAAVGLVNGQDVSADVTRSSASAGVVSVATSEATLRGQSVAGSQAQFNSQSSGVQAGSESMAYNGVYLSEAVQNYKLTSDGNSVISSSASPVALSVAPDVQVSPGESNRVANITGASVSGSADTNATGVAVFDSVTISVEGTGFTDDNLLTADGLHTSNDTSVEVISGAVVGSFDSPRFWGQNYPVDGATVYSFNIGDSYRLTNVGQTRSGTELDLIATITYTDADDWSAGYGQNSQTNGIAFVRGQQISTNNNSLVVLYNGANEVEIHYQIVKSGTMQEMPVLVSFINNDIDGSQGVSTNLDNIGRVIPSQTNLKVDDANNIIYDADRGRQSPTGAGMGRDINGVDGLPYGGYLGVGFGSAFDYDFFAPAPEVDDAYVYAMGVRYDLFGSALQGKVAYQTTAGFLEVHLTDLQGRPLVANPFLYVGEAGYRYQVVPPAIDGYELVKTTGETDGSLNTNKDTVTFVYRKQFKVPVLYLDEFGERLSDDLTLVGWEQDKYNLSVGNVSGMRLLTPASYSGVFSAQSKPIISRYEYERTLKIHYVDSDNNSLGTTLTLVGFPGQKFVVPSRQFADYQFEGQVGHGGQIGKATPFSDDLFMVYRKQVKVQVSLVDEVGNKLGETQIPPIIKGSTLTYTPPTLPGYELVSLETSPAKAADATSTTRASVQTWQSTVSTDVQENQTVTVRYIRASKSAESAGEEITVTQKLGLWNNVKKFVTKAVKSVKKFFKHPIKNTVKALKSVVKSVGKALVPSRPVSSVNPFRQKTGAPAIQRILNDSSKTVVHTNPLRQSNAVPAIQRLLAAAKPKPVKMATVSIGGVKQKVPESKVNTKDFRKVNGVYYPKKNVFKSAVNETILNPLRAYGGALLIASTVSLTAGLAGAYLIRRRNKRKTVGENNQRKGAGVAPSTKISKSSSDHKRNLKDYNDYAVGAVTQFMTRNVDRAQEGLINLTNNFKNTIGGKVAARTSVVGTAIDGLIQATDPENTAKDAVVKTVGHAAINLATVPVAGVLGGAAVTIALATAPISLPAAIVIGGIVTFIAGVGLNTVFDQIFDKIYDKKFGDKNEK